MRFSLFFFQVLASEDFKPLPPISTKMNNFHLYFISSVMFGFPFVSAFGILKIHSITSPLFQKKPKLTDEIQLRHRRTPEIFLPGLKNIQS